MKQLNDDDLFPFGKYGRTKMEKVPAYYLDWVVGQPWIDQWPAVVEYVERNRGAIDAELKEQGRI